MPEIDLLAALIERAARPGTAWEEEKEVWELVDDVARPELRDEADRVRAHLRAAVAARSVLARDCWATVLAGVAGVEAIPDLITAASVELDDDRALLHSTLLELVERRPSAAHAPILKVLRSEEALVRAKAIWAFSFLPPDESIAQLAVEALADPDAQVVKTAQWALGASSWKSIPGVAQALGAARRDPSGRGA